jgi:uncharacterized YccA/Bax inhibitor family protein
MRTGNPALNGKVFQQFEATANDRYDVAGAATTMTVAGTTFKTGILLLLAILTAGFTWNLSLAGQAAMPWMIGGMIGGLALALVTIFKPNWSPVTAPGYALAEGLLLGGISAMYSTLYDGIIVQAVMLTFGTMLSMLVAYGLGLVRATEKFRAGVFAATGGICLVYLVSFVMSFFGTSIPYIHGSGLIGIGFSLFVVVVAALNLVLDFDFIERGAAAKAPKYMEWYGAFGLMVTLVWLYIEILRLLSKLSRRN